MNPSEIPAGRNPELWRLARRRAKLKAQLVVFMFVNAGLWLLWALTDRTAHPVPWPLWVSGFWGLGLALRAFDAYGQQGRGLADREYERLMRNQ